MQFEEFSKKDQEILKQILTASTMQRAFAKVKEEAQEKLNQFMSLDLSKEGAVLEGIRIQAHYQGMLRVIDLLNDLVESDDV